jgi:hypothetical protein
MYAKDSLRNNPNEPVNSTDPSISQNKLKQLEEKVNQNMLDQRMETRGALVEQSLANQCPPPLSELSANLDL